MSKLSVRSSTVVFVPLLILLAAAVAVQAFYLMQMSRKIDTFETARSKQVQSIPSAENKNPAKRDAETGGAPEPPDPFALPPSVGSLFDDDFFRTPFDDDAWRSWNPQEQLEQMRKRMDDAFGRAFGRLDAGSLLDDPSGAGLFHAWMDVREEDAQYVITVDLPGIEKGELKVEVTGDTVTVSGTRSAEMKEESDLQGGRTLRRERSVGSFRRSITLEKPVRADNVETEFKGNGIVVIRIPKA